MAEIHAVSFSDLPADAGLSPADVREHRRSLYRFERLVLFGVLHIVSILAALALAFPGNAPVFGFLFGIVVNLGLIVAAALTANAEKA
ncbi:hypothetical protein SAMN02745126_05036 [Enhydrobacter aerosaccus]|uniref:Uncharacterized protein n=1 Tax=Enhydrobacter aerosaccus TaxID=225324 RepID=A0A1T4SRI4_9HYPH|nr:hypothetical protein [Enhydrobacter aerosaccus]SKA30845.1 hypothetical protein SAMN02745126_05036 [Enhydrobacter aerosaccus]